LLKQIVMGDFYEMTPEKFSNKTNGVTPRRFMVLSNPRLGRLITEKIGDAWVSKPEELRQLEKFVNNRTFRKE
jgi:glycogen phosphorylase